MGLTHHCLNQPSNKGIPYPGLRPSPCFLRVMLLISYALWPHTLISYPLLGTHLHLRSPPRVHILVSDIPMATHPGYHQYLPRRRTVTADNMLRRAWGYTHTHSTEPDVPMIPKSRSEAGEEFLGTRGFVISRQHLPRSLQGPASTSLYIANASPAPLWVPHKSGREPSTPT